MAAYTEDRATARVDPVTGTFEKFSWDELRRVIAADDLSVLTRDPASLAAYHGWKADIVARYGTVERYILLDRLRWPPPVVPASATPFRRREDWRCLRNDFPYACEPDIDHLVVWLKTPLPTTADGALTAEGARLLADFLRSHFHDVPEGDLLSFLNPPALKSIGNLEHFHVLLRNQDAARYCD